MPPPDTAERLRCYAITDRRALGGIEGLRRFVDRAVTAGIDLIQIREKDLTDRDLYELTRAAVDVAWGSATRIIVNDRLDIAVAAGAHGIHLGGHSVEADIVRRHAPAGFLIGVSTHSLEEAQRAKAHGADFITFGPVWFTASKARYGPPQGLKALQEILETIDIPVFPLGGITAEHLPELYPLPIAGIAAISLFQNAADLATMVQTIRQRGTSSA